MGSILIGHGFWLNGIVLMPRIGLPTGDLGETHSLQKACKPVAEVSFYPIFNVRFVKPTHNVILQSVWFCKSHSDEDTSQKELSVLNILSFLHRNPFYKVYFLSGNS